MGDLATCASLFVRIPHCVRTRQLGIRAPSDDGDIPQVAFGNPATMGTLASADRPEALRHHLSMVLPLSCGSHSRRAGTIAERFAVTRFTFTA